MNEVCTAAEVSKGSLYHHFPSKDELFLYVVEEDMRKWLQEWEEQRSRISGTEARLFALGDHYANDFQNPLTHALEEYARSRTLPDDFRSRLSESFNRVMQVCRELLQEGMDSGYLRSGDLENSVIALSGILEGISRVNEIAAIAQTREEIRAYYRSALQMLLQGMRAGEESNR